LAVVVVDVMLAVGDGGAEMGVVVGGVVVVVRGGRTACNRERRDGDQRRG